MKESKTRELFIALSSGEPAEIIQKILDQRANVHGPDETEDRETPLHCSARYGEDPRIIQTLISAGADLNARNNNGTSPLHHAAAFSKKPEVVRALVDAGADIHARNHHGYRAFDVIPRDSALRGTNLYWKLKDRSHR